MASPRICFPLSGSELSSAPPRWRKDPRLIAKIPLWMMGVDPSREAKSAQSMAIPLQATELRCPRDLPAQSERNLPRMQLVQRMKARPLKIKQTKGNLLLLPGALRRPSVRSVSHVLMYHEKSCPIGRGVWTESVPWLHQSHAYCARGDVTNDSTN